MAKNNKKVDIAVGKVGMKKDNHPSSLQEAEYTHALNTNIEDSSGNAYNLTNEHSNVLSSKFKAGFQVHGVENDILTNSTYFLLIHKTTGVGELGVIENNQQVNDLQDITVDCTDCDSIKTLALPLEDIIQTPLQQYTTLISDACKSNPTEGFNFNKLKPIKTIVIKNEKCGKVMYITDDYNPPRFILLNDIESYFVQKEPCNDEEVISCPDFEKLRIFKLFNVPIAGDIAPYRPFVVPAIEYSVFAAPSAERLLVAVIASA